MISIRSMKASEIEGMKGLIRRIFPDALVRIHDNDTLLLAEHLGRAVGFAHLVDGGDHLVLQGIGVEESVRGQGVGTLLLEHVLEMQDDGRPIYLRVRALNPAVDFYARYGFFVKRFGDHVHVLVKKPDA